MPHDPHYCLDNPIWNALTSAQGELAEGTSEARRYPEAIGPLAGIPYQAENTYEALSLLPSPEESLVLFLSEPPVLPEAWHLEVGGQLTQMVYHGQAAPTAHNSFIVEPLGVSDVPEMLVLTHLTKPGPFRQRTHELGCYFGIRDANGRLLAMAGERSKTATHTEVSAVCTHPDAQGKGYAQAVIMRVIAHILDDGKIPFLHTRPDNLNAIHVYEKLGFQVRRQLHLAVLRLRVPSRLPS